MSRPTTDRVDPDVVVVLSRTFDRLVVQPVPVLLAAQLTRHHRGADLHGEVATGATEPGGRTPEPTRFFSSGSRSATDGNAATSRSATDSAVGH